MKNLYELKSKYTIGSLESVTVTRLNELDRDILNSFYSHSLTKLSPDTIVEYFDGGSFEKLTIKDCMKMNLPTEDISIIF